MRTATIFSLSAESSYTFKIQAVNEKTVAGAENVGSGYDTSLSATFSTSVATLPGPSVLNATHFRPPTGGAISISWKAPVDSGI